MKANPYPLFLEEYPKSNALCGKLRQILSRYSDTEIAAASGYSSKDVQSFLSPDEDPSIIPKGFIQSIYEHTACDVNEINRLISSNDTIPSSEAASTMENKPSSNSSIECMEAVRKGTGKSKIRKALKDPHNYELFDDVSNCLSLPAETRKQVKAIFHAIIKLCMSSTSYQLVHSEKELQRLNKYYGTDKKETHRHMLLEKAQRAHYIDYQYLTAKKLYIRLIRNYPKTAEYYEACLGLLTLCHSSFTNRYLKVQETHAESNVIMDLSNPELWNKLCKEFDQALLTPSGKLKRHSTSTKHPRSKNYGGGYSHNRLNTQSPK